MTAVSHHVLTKSSSSGWTEWDEFVHRSRSGTVYHTSSWLLALAEGMGQDIRVHVVTESDDIRAGAAVRRGGKLGLVVACKPWATAYNGIVTEYDHCGPFVETLVCNLLGEYHHVRLVHSPAAGETVRHLSGWKIKHSTTPILDISDIEALWCSFDRRVRQRVRKATAAEVTVSETNDAAAFFELYRLTYVRQGMPMPLEKEEVADTLDLACATGDVKIFLARTKTGDPAAALVAGADTKRAYFMLAGSHPELRKTDAMTLTWWRAIQQYATTHQEIDLVGVGTPGIERFKRSFSPHMVEFLDTSCYSSSLAAIACRGGKLAGYIARKVRHTVQGTEL